MGAEPVCLFITPPSLLKLFMPRSLYIHIPFCVKRCAYCDFVSGVYDPAKADACIKALRKELAGIPEGTALSTLYIGGGTPTVLPASRLAELIRNIFSRFRFMEDYEATIEANPGTLDREKAGLLMSSGINRISIGVQSFNRAELELLGRIHSPEEAEQAVRIARDAGCENIGIDLIYAIPGQDMDSWKKTLAKAVSLMPEHISAYELTVEKGTVLYERLNAGRPQGGDGFRLPEEATVIEMYEYTIDYLKAGGFVHYEVSNFAVPGWQCRHNLNYWDRGEYYGVGPGAHSFLNGTRYCNTSALDEYTRAVSEKGRPPCDAEEITGDRAVSEAVFLGLRKTGGLCLESFARLYGQNILSRYGRQISRLEDAGLIEMVSVGCSYETSLRLTRKGLLLSNEVFEKFM